MLWKWAVPLCFWPSSSSESSSSSVLSFRLAVRSLSFHLPTASRQKRVDTSWPVTQRVTDSLCSQLYPRVSDPDFILPMQWRVLLFSYCSYCIWFIFSVTCQAHRHHRAFYTLKHIYITCLSHAITFHTDFRYLPWWWLFGFFWLFQPSYLEEDCLNTLGSFLKQCQEPNLKTKRHVSVFVLMWKQHRLILLLNLLFCKLLTVWMDIEM